MSEEAAVLKGTWRGPVRRRAVMAQNQNVTVQVTASHRPDHARAQHGAHEHSEVGLRSKIRGLCWSPHPGCDVLWFCKTLLQGKTGQSAQGVSLCYCYFNCL